MNSLKQRKIKNILLENVLFVIVCLCIFLGVWFITEKSIQNEYVFPSLQKVFKKIGQIITDKNFWKAFGGTMKRVSVAFLVSFFSSLIISVLSYEFVFVKKILSPFISIFRALPTLAIILILLVWTSPNTAPVVVAYFTLFPLLYTAFLTLFEGVDKQLIEMSKVYKVSRFQQITKLYIPNISYGIIRESASAFSFALKIVVSAEIISNTYLSIGGSLQEYKLFLEIPSMFALTLIIVAVGVVVELIGNVISDKVREKVL